MYNPTEKEKKMCRDIVKELLDGDEDIKIEKIVDEVFNKLGIRVLIKINNRKILEALADVIGYPKKLVEITVAIDKIEKIGLDGVKEELRASNIDEKAICTLEPILTSQGSAQEKLSLLKEVIGSSEIGAKGIAEMEYIIDTLESLSLSSGVEIDLSLARGLNYYTGSIFEVKALDYAIGSICGGGRYDGLVENLLGVKVPATGASIGVDRLAELLTLTGQTPENQQGAVIIVVFDDNLMPLYQKTAADLRKNGINTEIYYGAKRGLKHQMAYADKNNCPIAVIIGEDEAKKGTATIKNLKLGKILADKIADKNEWKAKVQKEVELSCLAQKIKEELTIENN